MAAFRPPHGDDCPICREQQDAPQWVPFRPKVWVQVVVFLLLLTVAYVVLYRAAWGNWPPLTRASIQSMEPSPVGEQEGEA